MFLGRQWRPTGSLAVGPSGAETVSPLVGMVKRFRGGATPAFKALVLSMPMAAWNGLKANAQAQIMIAVEAPTITFMHTHRFKLTISSPHHQS